MILIYWFGSDEDIEFEYEVDLEVLHEAVVTYYSEKYGFMSAECKSLVEELYYNDLLNYTTDCNFEDYIKECCYEDAYYQFQEEEKSNNPYSYYGISESDFH